MLLMVVVLRTPEQAILSGGLWMLLLLSEHHSLRLESPLAQKTRRPHTGTQAKTAQWLTRKQTHARARPQARRSSILVGVVKGSR